MKNRKKTVICMASLALIFSAHAFPQGEKDGQGQVVVTIMPKHSSEAAPMTLAPDAKSNMTLKINGKDSAVTSFVPLRGPQSPLELVVLLDSGARSSLGRQFDDISRFIQGLPPNAKVAIAYMQNGRAVFTNQLTGDHALALKDLHLPGGAPGSDASPYFCLSDLAKNWPSTDRTARREVLAVTDGIDYYNPR